MSDDTTHTITGRALDVVSEQRLSLENLLQGQLTTEDFRISAETLRQQAEAAEAAGYQAFAQNLRRAAELTRISNQDVLDMYNLLRPGRTTHRQLIALADRLEREFDAPLTAALVREAAAVYLERGLVKVEKCGLT